MIKSNSPAERELAMADAGGAAAVAPPPAPDEPSRGAGARLQDISSNYGVLIALVIMAVGFSIALPDTFPTWLNARTIISDQSIAIIVALATMLPLVVGEFDLSIGANLGFSSVTAAYLSSHGTPVVVVLVACVVLGALVGTVNAILVRVGVHAFIATLGTSTILGGGNLLVTKGTPIFEGIPQSLKSISQNEVFGLRMTVVYALVLVAILYYLLEWTPVGRYLRATGVGREAARLTGVRTNLWLSASFVAAGAIAGLAGFLQTATVAAASPTVGPEFVLPAFAAAFLGTTTIVRGFFNVWGTIAGVFLLAIGTSGLALAGAPTWVQPVFNGSALLVAVTWAVLAGRAKAGGSSPVAGH